MKIKSFGQEKNGSNTHAYRMCKNRDWRQYVCQTIKFFGAMFSSRSVLTTAEIQIEKTYEFPMFKKLVANWETLRPKERGGFVVI